jgi:alkylated DNA repair dioxygenase AlkB
LNTITLINDFITTEQELVLLSQVPNKDKESRCIMTRYGNFPDFIIHTDIVPDYLNSLVSSILNANLIPESPDLFQINQYYNGQGMNMHSDSFFNGDWCAIISLNSDALMRFVNDTETVEMTIPRRSLLMFSGDARIAKHEIVAESQTEMRFSIAFRKRVGE